MEKFLDPNSLEKLTEQEKSLQARSPSAYEDASEDAGMSEQDERMQYFANNLVMKEMKQRQEREGLPPDQVPKPRPLGEPARSFSSSGTTESRQESEMKTYAREELAGPRGGDSSSLAVFPGEGLMAQGYEKQRRGSMIEGAALADAADREAAILQQGSDAQKDINQEYLDKQKELEAYKNEVVQKADTLLERMREKKIDPNRYWNNRSTGQKIMLTLGAFASGYAGQGQNFINNIKSFIDSDIQQQKDAYNRLGSEAKNMISIASQIYEPGLEAAEAARSMGLEALKSTLQAKMATTKSKQLRASIPKMIGAIDVEQGKAMNAIALNRMKQAADNKKSVKLGSEAARAIGQGVDALDALNQMEDFIKKEGGGRFARNLANTFLGLGDNKFSDALRKYSLFVGFMNSGANVPESEKTAFNSTIVRFGDSEEMVRRKIKDAQKLLKRRVDIFGQGAGYEPGEVFKNLQHERDPRVRVKR